ncbi:MAG: Gfo/Idh/MocA family oxidoreductase [Chitinophagaceae bacterium]
MGNQFWSRRHFIRNLSLGAAALSPALSAMAARKDSHRKDKLGIALVGLGSYSTYQLAPALLETKNCYLAGIVTGTPAKEQAWAAKYNIPAKNSYNYRNFDSIASNDDIDIVYIVLPVSMHKEYTIRAAQAGKHVICEKPMALNVTECEEMIAACKKADRMLSIGYRLHFEPYNQEMMRLGQQQVYGKLLEIDCANGFTYGPATDPNIWRLKKSMAGGGSLMDMGVYAVQGARYTTGEEPVSVTAREEKTRHDLFREVDETIYFELQFPSGCTAKGISSYNKNLNHLKAKAANGSFELSQAYRYGGMAGRTPAGPMNFPSINQQAAQMDDFAACVQQQKQTRVPGEMGLKDMKVIEAIYRSIASGRKEKV